MNQEITASKILDLFQSVWCEREDTKVLEFNCNRCEFEKDGMCLVRMFTHKHEPQDDTPQRMIKQNEVRKDG